MLYLYTLTEDNTEIKLSTISKKLRYKPGRHVITTPQLATVDGAKTTVLICVKCQTVILHENSSKKRPFLKNVSALKTKVRKLNA